MHRFNSTTNVFAKRDESANEFNSSYKSYLETKLVYSCLSDFVSNLNKIDSNSISSTAQQAGFEEKITENYWKAFLLTELGGGKDQKGLKPASNYGSAPTEIRIEDDIRPEKLSDEEKSFLVGIFEEHFEKKLREIERFLKDDKGASDKSMQQSTYDSMSERSPVDTDQLLDEFNKLTQSIVDLDVEIDRLNDDVCVKLDHCLFVSTQIVKLLQMLLSDFRLGFYAQENVASCQNQLIKCEMVLAKINLVKNELIADLYSSDKLKALKIIKSQLKIETAAAAERKNQLIMTLEQFKSFGPEFEEVRKEYLRLMEELESKKRTLEKFKQNYI